MTNLHPFLSVVGDELNITFTDNGDEARASTLDSHLEIFARVSSYRNDLPQFLDDVKRAYHDDPALTLRLLLWMRDCRGGAGERTSLKGLCWLMKQNSALIRPIMEKLVEVGRYKDLVDIYQYINNEKSHIAFVAIQVFIDALNSEDAGLAAKWVPLKRPFGYHLARHMKMSRPDFRKFVVARRSTVETKMCAQEWANINYKSVPSIAMTRYMQAFSRHDNERFGEYLSAVDKGETTINTSVAWPHEVLAKSTAPGATQMWDNLPNYVPEGKRILPVVDVSGSMSSESGAKGHSNMHMAISLGMYLAERNTGPYHNSFISFSTDPKLHTIKGTSLADRYSLISRADWGYSTDISKVYDLLLSAALRGNFKPEDMPTDLVIFSDMQFDSASSEGYNGRSFDIARKKWEEAGYELPRLVFWNLSAGSKSALPIDRNDINAVLLSGFSPSMFTSVFSGATSKELLLEILQNDRYKVYACS